MAHTGEPGARPSSAKAVAVTSAISGTSPASSQRTVAPCGVAPASRAGQTLRGLPSGRDGVQRHGLGADGGEDRPGRLLGDGDHATAVQPHRRPAPRSGQQRQPDQPGHVVGPRTAGDLGRRARPAPPAPSSTTTTRSASAMASTGSWVTSTALPSKSRQVPAQLRAHGQPGAGVERGQRLVEQQQPRARRPARGPARPAGPGRRRARRDGGRRGRRGPRGPATGRPVACRGLRPIPRRPQAERDVVGDREVREQQVVLEDHPDAAPVRRQVWPRASSQTVAVDDDAAAVRAAAGRPARAAGWTCPRRWARGRRAPRRRRRPASTSRSERRPRRTAHPARTGSCGTRARPSQRSRSSSSVASETTSRTRREHDRGLRVVLAAPGRRPAASSASCRGSCRRR